MELICLTHTLDLHSSYKAPKVIWCFGMVDGFPKKKTYVKKLEGVKRLASLCCTKAIFTIPSAELSSLVAKNLAEKSALRLTVTRRFTQRLLGHSNLLQLTGRSDYAIPHANFKRGPDVIAEQGWWKKGLRLNS